MIVENFLSEKELTILQETIINNEFPWYFQSEVTNKGSLEEKNAYFTHTIFNQIQKSNYFGLINDIILKKIKPFALLRIKINCYPRTEKIIHHPKHFDFPIKHKGFIYYLNTCDGFTVLNDGTKIESVKNRALFFDSAIEHNSTTCTDAKARFNININYI